MQIMKKRVEKTKYICMLLLCIGVTFGCVSDQGTNPLEDESETVQISNQEEEQESSLQEALQEEATQEASVSEIQMEQNETISYEEGENESLVCRLPLEQNETMFYEEAEKQGIDRQTAEEYFQILMEDNVFQDGKMALTGLRIDDIDKNGQIDMLVMVLDAKETPFYGSGGLWFYMNNDTPYYFSEEMCSYYGWFDTFWEDIDNDGNVEIVFSAQGTGCGAVGDSYKAVFKYRNLLTDSSEKCGIERMQLPSDFEENYDCGIEVEVFKEPEKNQYSAYCPYFDETISFHAENIGEDLPSTAISVGGEVRGFYNLCPVGYNGKMVLQASEYLNGEGGTVHNVATAQFLITWKEDGTPEIIKWWIEED